MIPLILAIVDCDLVLGLCVDVEGESSSFCSFGGGSESSSERLGSLIRGFLGFILGNTGKEKQLILQENSGGKTTHKSKRFHTKSLHSWVS